MKVGITFTISKPIEASCFSGASSTDLGRQTSWVTLLVAQFWPLFMYRFVHFSSKKTTTAYLDTAT